MRLAQVSVLFIVVAGCAAVAPEATVAPTADVVVRGPTAAPPPAASAATPAAGHAVPGTQAPAAASAPPAGTKPAAHGAAAPLSATRPPAASSAPGGRPATQSAAATPSAARPALDLNGLKEQLKETKAIGVLTKLTLKNQVDDLLQQFHDFYQGKTRVTMAELRRSYDLLLMKVLSLLQDGDQKLASAIVASREAIWGLLSDPKKFATLEG